MVRGLLTLGRVGDCAGGRSYWGLHMGVQGAQSNGLQNHCRNPISTGPALDI
jgi:hypothetical protein